jgi:hypothetical protein
MGDKMSYRDYFDRNEKYVKASNEKIQSRNIDIIVFSIFSFAFGFAGGLMPQFEGLMLGVAFFFIVGLFIYHPAKKR